MLALDTHNNTNAKTYIIFFLLTYTSEDFISLRNRSWYLTLGELKSAFEM